MTDPEREIRSFLRAEADQASLSPGMYQRVLRRSKSRRRVTAAATGLVALALVATGVVTTGALHSSSGQLAGPPAHSAAPLTRGQIVRIPVGRDPQPIAADDAGAWVVTGSGETTNILWHIDAGSNHAVKLPQTRGAIWPAVGGGFAWVTCNGSANPCGGNSVLKLDRDTGATLATIRLPAASNTITTGLGSVWVSTSAGLVKIDPNAARVVATFPIDTNLLGTAGGSVWATDPRGVGKIDPVNGHIVKQVSFHDPCELLATDHGVWVSSCMSVRGRGDHLTRIDPRTARISYRVPTKPGGSLAFASHRLWLLVWIKDHFEIAARDPAT
ncbi:MAG: hypothetical protein M3P18_07795, partial [Actinomycetota bacterium]|nr:hypothetical protein [Actinomycetota bacterium]